MAANELAPWINSAGENGYRNSMAEFQGDGKTIDFEFNFAGGYLRQSDVKAYLYDNTSGLTTDVSASLVWVGPNTVQYSPAIPDTQYIVIYRDSQKTGPMVDFTTNARMTEANLDLVAKQAIFVAAEMVDRFDAINSSSSDAIERSFTALTTAQAAQAQATAAVTTSNSAQTAAANALTNANSAVSVANNAQSVANGIDGKAQSALDNSVTAVNTANAANTTASGIDAKATAALSNSATAVTTANAASSAANTAVSTANAVQAIALQFLTSVPSSKVADAIYVAGYGLMRWVTRTGTGAYTGYEAEDVGMVQFETASSLNARAGFVSLTGDTISTSDTSSQALIAWARRCGLVVASGSYVVGAMNFGENGDGTLKLPDLRGVFPMFASADRAEGSFGAQSILSHTHTVTVDSAGAHTHSGATDSQGAHAHTYVSGSQGVGYQTGGASPVRENAYTSATSTDGAHAHNLSINTAGAHTHAATATSSGGIYNRPNNIAFVARMHK
ncbi:MAG: hypothetical protein GAK35_02208 [Herbaspirillum frisingense]|uniref:Bacteriophage T7 tail fibre protein-like N-terminal domain-containing protein n=1 Tax=Herbaspirillum frisingense TaxID=92645 RepID=A0A7V8FWL6_9BURK|nr:MAG: hypothetical protein GAK35_02208 [Herbaspirillum frisingense]